MSPLWVTACSGQAHRALTRTPSPIHCRYACSTSTRPTNCWTPTIGESHSTTTQLSCGSGSPPPSLPRYNKRCRAPMLPLILPKPVFHPSPSTLTLPTVLRPSPGFVLITASSVRSHLKACGGGDLPSSCATTG